MKRGLVITDLDGVLYDMVGHVAHTCLHRWNLLLHPENCRQWSLSQFIETAEGSDWDKDNAKTGIAVLLGSDRGRVRHRGDPEWYDACPTYPGTQVALQRLSRHFDVVALSSRPLSMILTTRRCVNRDFPDIQEVHLTRHKPEWAQRVHPTFVLEDSAETVERYLRKRVGGHVIYITRSYSRPIALPIGTRRRLLEIPGTVEAVEEMLRLAGVKEETYVPTV